MEIAIAAFLLLGLVIGTAAGWFFRSARASQSEEMLRETRTRLEQVDKERVAALDELRVESSRRASFEALQRRAWEFVPYIPAGQFDVFSAYRPNVTGILDAAFIAYWNIEKR